MSIWSRKEKRSLLSGLYKYGPKNIEKLQKLVWTKSKNEITQKINSYMELASQDTQNKPSINTKRKPKPLRYSTWPNDYLVNTWIQVISHWCSNDSTKSLLPEALRIIAHLEDHPSPETLMKVDLKSLYLYLADVIEGQTPPEISPFSREFLINVLLELTAKSRNETLTEETNHVFNITRIFPNATRMEADNATPTSRALNELLSSISYNPLAIPERFMENIEENFDEI